MEKKPEILESGPFSGIDISELLEPDADIMRKSNEDFLLVLDGKIPKHATLNSNIPPVLDGSTTSYLGNRYEIVIVESPSTFGGIHGYIYGPVITFERRFAPGSMTTVNNLRFYTNEQLKKLKQ